MNDETLQGLLEKRGLAWDAPQLAPFTLLRCPLCGGAHFATIEMCSVWCRCNARFEVTSMRDDSLTCVLTWRSYWPTATRYIVNTHDGLPRDIRDFYATKVLEKYAALRARYGNLPVA